MIQAFPDLCPIRVSGRVSILLDGGGGRRRAPPSNFKNRVMNTPTNPGQIRNPSRYGFATFFKEDGQYFFQFNDQKGLPIFYSHGYQSERSRDNGIQVAIRNAGEEERYERKQSKKGQHFFILKSGNNQEIGRSITFNSQSEMEGELNVMKGITKDVPIFDAAELALEKKIVEARSIAESLELPSTKELPIEKLPRYKFSIIYYPDSEMWAIKHDQSGNSKQFKPCDGKLIEDFLKAHLPAEKARALTTTDPAIASPKAPTQEGIPRRKDIAAEEEFELKLRSYRGEEVQHFAKVGNLGQMEILPKKRTTISNEIFEARVTAKPLGGAETVVIAEVKGQTPAYGRFLIPIYEANKLKPGMYRFTVNIHQGKEGEEVHDYSGSSLVMLN